MNGTVGLAELDREFMDNYSAILMRFYGLFKSIAGYLEGYQDFISNLRSGIFIQNTTESVLQNPHGKQLRSTPSRSSGPCARAAGPPAGPPC